MTTPVRDQDGMAVGTHESSDLTEPKLPNQHRGSKTEKQSRDSKFKAKEPSADKGVAAKELSSVLNQAEKVRAIAAKMTRQTADAAIGGNKNSNYASGSQA
eukprot:CAMPEP_0170471764 /NCGR_PEP_ID=MMETSP0123-20130129/13934_1 /TAXON_ID=182087 /ORGANISM="Favella ehrenbergii, Strain Fehren 1" /LENGTH=100 /DNA_ID=CAMNT_0010739639 /DNA_START=538 /DNA_END=837 /DNA_ORIENTATION=-